VAIPPSAAVKLATRASLSPPSAPVGAYPISTSRGPGDAGLGSALVQYFAADGGVGNFGGVGGVGGSVTLTQVGDVFAGSFSTTVNGTSLSGTFSTSVGTPANYGCP
jgi:hypothetical protein